MTRSHYETLGVDDGADPEVVRRAYLDLARRLHPDRWIDAGGEERLGVERRMQEVNEAWRVLGNPARRLAYDSRHRRPPTSTTGPVPGSEFTTGGLFVDDDPTPDLVGRLVRALPWGLVLLALGAIFVFTAYATDDSNPESCVRRDGATASSVPCDADGARQVVSRVPEVGLCPAGTEAFQPADREQALCLRR